MPIDFTLKRSARARSLRLSIYPDGEVVVTAPKSYSDRLVERFVGKHSQWIQKHVSHAQRRNVIRMNKKDIPSLKKKAREIAEAKASYFAALYGLSFNSISIRAQKTRWGSCSQNGNLSFNYKIAVLPVHLVDYIIVHELCHLRHLNHSADFWRLVGLSIPEHKQQRKELRNIVALVSR